MKISAVIITYNEERNIERCLESIRPVADEIIIVDSFSTDNTLKIAQQYNPTIIQKEWLGYANTKNFANQQAKYNMILSIDADEALSIELINEIIKIKEKEVSPVAFKFNRLNYFCNKPIKHAGWFPEWKTRLFDKRKAHWTGNFVHEKLSSVQHYAVKKVSGYLLHYPVVSVSEQVFTINKYADLQAQEWVTHKKTITWFHLFLKPSIEFLRCYVWRMGFLDGWRGLAISYLSATAKFLRVIKALELREKNNVR